MVTEALNVVKRQMFDFLSSVLTATPGDKLTVKHLLRVRPEVLSDATIQYRLKMTRIAINDNKTVRV